MDYQVKNTDNDRYSSLTVENLARNIWNIADKLGLSMENLYINLDYRLIFGQDFRPFKTDWKF